MERIRAYWTKIPLIIRAILNGITVQVIGFALLVILFPLNPSHLPNVPWVLLPLGLSLWLYWSYFGGKGWPGSSSQLRKSYRRAHHVDRALYPRMIFIGLVYAATILCISILQYSYRTLPPEALGMVSMLSELPFWSAVPLALLAALFVGMGEEMSYRGYMQVPLEQRHKPYIFLSIPALVFAMSHGLNPENLPIFFFVSLGWGVIAWSTGSIWPGIVIHFIVDSVGFIWGIFALDDLEFIMQYSIAESGWTSGFQILALVTLALVILTIWNMIGLRKLANRY